MAKEKRRAVMELFGPTIQGEGLMSGTITHFLRFGGCGLRCSWCDSMFAVDPKLIRKHRTLMTDAQILYAIGELPKAPWITFTGGDPCLQKDLGGMIHTLNVAGIQVAVETQGQLFPEWMHEVDVATFSPKGPSSGNIVDAAHMIEQIHDMYGWLPQHRNTRICIKIVVFDELDFSYALNVYNTMPAPLYDAFYFTAGTPQELPHPDKLDETDIMLNGVHRTYAVLESQKQLAGMLLDAAPVNNFNEKVHMGCQQHVLLWPDKDKGV